MYCRSFFAFLMDFGIRSTLGWAALIHYNYDADSYGDLVDDTRHCNCTDSTREIVGMRVALVSLKILWAAGQGVGIPVK